MLMIGQGDVLAGKRRANGTVESLRNIGEAPVFEVMISTTKVEDNETSSGLRRQILSVITGQKAEVTVTFKEPTPENLALSTYGTITDVAGQTLTNEPMPSGLVAGVWYRLPKDITQVSGIALMDSAATPVALTLNTHYILDEVFGLIQFTSAGISSKTQPFKVSGTGEDETHVSMLSDTPENITLVLHQINTADGFAPEIWELYNVQIDPADKLEGKGDKAAEFTIKGSALIDPKKPKDPVLGQFGRIRKLTAV
jgi:hypothetical protein